MSKNGCNFALANGKITQACMDAKRGKTGRGTTVIPVVSTVFQDSVAQLVEQMTLNHWVEGSSPSGVTKQNGKMPQSTEIT